MNKDIQLKNCPECGGRMIHNKQEKRMKCEYCKYYTGVVKGNELVKEMLFTKKMPKFNGESTEKSVLHKGKRPNDYRR